MKKTITAVAAALLIALTSCNDNKSQVMYIDGAKRGLYHGLMMTDLLILTKVILQSCQFPIQPMEILMIMI